MEILSFRPAFLLPKFISAARHFFGREVNAGGIGSLSGRIWVHDPVIIIPFSRAAYRGIFGISLRRKNVGPKKSPRAPPAAAGKFSRDATIRFLSRRRGSTVHAR